MSTFTQIHVHIVFSTLNREQTISPKWESRLYKFITGLIQNKGCKVLAIGGMPDHIHILIGQSTNICLADLVKEMKRSSGNFIRSQLKPNQPFYWQEGYGAFSYSKSQLPRVINYILNQKVHHSLKDSRSEYVQILKNFELEYKEEYVK